MGIKHQIEMANSIVFYCILPSLEHDHCGFASEDTSVQKMR